MSILVTPSLFGSVDWYQTCPDSWRQKAEDDLVGMITRTSKWEPSHAVQRGINFEDTIYRVLRTNSDKRGSEYFNLVLEMCRGGLFQKKSKKIIKHRDMEFCFYGKLDVWFHDCIKDIKTTSVGKTLDEYREKYLTSMQHHIYCMTERIDRFVYIVILFDDRDKIVDVIEIEYLSNLDTEQQYVLKKLDELIEFFDAHPEWKDHWLTKYSLY